MVKNNTNGDIGAVKLTIQKFYRINGGSNQLEGVKSDVVIPNRYSYIDIGEKNEENPLPWSKIEPAQYEVWDSYFDYDMTIAKSKERMAKNEQLKLIDENAKWVKKIRDREQFPLNYEAYKASLDVSDKETKHFEELSNYQTNLTFESLSQEMKLMEQDSILREKRELWHKNLSKDVYIEEAINVLNDMKMTYGIKNKVTASVKN
jgi:carboxyl-terminal processing protease